MTISYCCQLLYVVLATLQNNSPDVAVTSLHYSLFHSNPNTNRSLGANTNSNRYPIINRSLGANTNSNRYPIINRSLGANTNSNRYPIINRSLGANTNSNPYPIIPPLQH